MTTAQLDHLRRIDAHLANPESFHAFHGLTHNIKDEGRRTLDLANTNSNL